MNIWGDRHIFIYLFSLLFPFTWSQWSSKSFILTHITQMQRLHKRLTLLLFRLENIEFG
jgi:hypothetical protein